MIGLFSNLPRLFVVDPNHVSVDNWVFRLHYRITCVALMVCCLMVSASQFIGEPIKCIMDNQDDEDFEEAVNTYCWIRSTYSLPYQWNKIHGSEVAYPGVGPHGTTGERKYHAYYQWVPFFLFFQSILFYAPHWIWNAWEGSHIKGLLAGYQGHLMTWDERKSKIQVLTTFISHKLGDHGYWYFKYILCESLLLVNVIGNIYFTDAFLGYEFSKFGLEAMTHSSKDPEHRVDPLIRVFPRVTKCDFHMYGPSGTIQRNDIMCILAWNIMNEKIFLFAWFWFVILAILTIGLLFYRILSISSNVVRTHVLRSRCSRAHRAKCESLVRHCSQGDWFLLSHLGKNMSVILFDELIEALAESFSIKSKSGSHEDLVSQRL